MRARAAMMMVAVIGSLVAAGCRSPENDPFVDLSMSPAEVSTVGGAVPTSIDPGIPVSVAIAATVPSSAVPAATAPAAPAGDLAVAELASVAFGETVDASIACLADPAVCDPAVVAIPGGPAHERYARLVAVFHERGYVVRRVADLSRWTVESVAEGADPDALVAVVCDVDADEVIEPAATNGLGVDLTINDQMVARRVSVELRRTAAGWRRWSVEQLGEWPMEPACLVG